VLWRLTTRDARIEPDRVIVPYLVTVITFLSFAAEEYAAYIRRYHHILEGAPLPLTLESLLLFAATQGRNRFERQQRVRERRCASGRATRAGRSDASSQPRCDTRAEVGRQEASATGPGRRTR